MACTIDSLIHEAVATLKEDATVQQAAELMTQQNVTSLLVIRSGEVVGLFTERDLLRRVVGARRDPLRLRLGEVCTRRLVSISHDSSCGQAIEKMQTHLCRRLLVYRGQQFIGLINLTDVAHAMADKARGKDLVVNALGAVTLVVAIGVIAMLLLQLPNMLQFAEQVTAR
jgi:CBS domain-containing protein